MQNSHYAPTETEDLLSSLFGNFQTETFQETLDLSVKTDWYKFKVDPRPTPRPRARGIVKGTKNGRPLVSAQIYNPTEYTEYKEELAKMFKFSSIPKAKYNCADIVFGIPLFKSYSKKEKERLVWTLHDKKPDFDNYVKVVLDALQDSGKIVDDSKFGSGFIEKIWIPEESDGFIMIKLIAEANPRIDVRSLRNVILVK